MAAIPTATARAAELLDMEGKLGVITAGAYADVIAVNSDPLQDVKALENVQFVMKDGTVFKGENVPMTGKGATLVVPRRRL